MKNPLPKQPANHEVWRQCQNCGAYNDLRKSAYCEDCGSKINNTAKSFSEWMLNTVKSIHYADWGKDGQSNRTKKRAMKIEDIIYDTTREVFNLDDKLSIATIFLFCRKIGSEKLSELLYTADHQQFVEDLNEEYKDYDVDFTINFSNPNVRSAFFKTLEKVKEKWDSDGFLKALAERDEYAIAICEIMSSPIIKL